MPWNVFLCKSLRFGDTYNCKWVREGLERIVGWDYISDRWIERLLSELCLGKCLLFSGLIRTRLCLLIDGWAFELPVAWKWISQLGTWFPFSPSLTGETLGMEGKLCIIFVLHRRHSFGFSGKTSQKVVNPSLLCFLSLRVALGALEKHSECYYSAEMISKQDTQVIFLVGNYSGVYDIL